MFDFPLTRADKSSDPVNHFTNQAATAGLLEYVTKEELNQEGFDSGVIITDRSSYDFAVIWPHLTHLIGDITTKNYRKIKLAAKQMKSVQERKDATFIFIAEPEDSLRRKERDSSSSVMFMNEQSLNLIKDVYLLYYLKFLNDGSPNVALINTSAPEDEVQALVDNLLLQISKDVLIPLKSAT